MKLHLNDKKDSYYKLKNGKGFLKKSLKYLFNSHNWNNGDHYKIVIYIWWDSQAL